MQTKNKSLFSLVCLSSVLIGGWISSEAAAEGSHQPFTRGTRSSVAYKRHGLKRHKPHGQRVCLPAANQTGIIASDLSARNYSNTGFNNSTSAGRDKSLKSFSSIGVNQTNSQFATNNHSSWELFGSSRKKNSQPVISSGNQTETESSANLSPALGNARNTSDKVVGQTSPPNTTSSENSTTTLGTSGNSFSAQFSSGALQKSNLFLGFLPDDGSSGGTRMTMAQINALIGARSAVYGWYSQAHSGTPFDGSQLLAVIDDVKACNCIFQPAVMPIGGWQGLTSSDNSQAVAIANVMKKFTDEGIPVWLRFAHEVNYYQTDGTYQGTAADFKAGWAQVAAAVKQIAPSVKMFWTPNVDSAERYAAYEPDDMSTVDVVGVDYYPKKLTGHDFLDTMKTFHDKYAVDGRQFAIGETGLGWAGEDTDKFNWLNEIVVARSSMPEFIAMAWFNFDKEYDYKIAGETVLDQKLTSFLAIAP